METKPMKILIIEDNIDDRNKFVDCINARHDVELVGATDSDIDGLKYVQIKKPEGIILDIELNNSKSGNSNSFGFISNLKKLNLDYEPIIIVTTYINSKRTYDILHRSGVDMIFYKEHPNYSCDYVLNQFINLRRVTLTEVDSSFDNLFEKNENKVSDLINRELELIGVTCKLKGRQYIHDAILYLLENENSDISVIQHLAKIHKKSRTTITNGIQNAIIHAWRVSSIEDLLKYYTNRVNPETGIPTPIEFVYYYKDKIQKMI